MALIQLKGQCEKNVLTLTKFLLVTYLWGTIHICEELLIFVGSYLYLWGVTYICVSDLGLVI